jgi:Contractile injection system tube protein
MGVSRRGMLLEYGLRVPPLALVFDFNPQQISRTRTVTIKTGTTMGTRGGYDFLSPLETSRVAQGVEMAAESFSVDIMLDCTDKMQTGDALAAKTGVQPQIDTLRTMLQPKTQGPGGMQTLVSLATGGQRAFERHEAPSVLVFVWGVQVLPVFLTGVTQKETMHLPNLLPYRADMQISMQVIESANPFFTADRVRQAAMTALNAVDVTGVF